MAALRSALGRLRRARFLVESDIANSRYRLDQNGTALMERLCAAWSRDLQGGQGESVAGCSWLKGSSLFAAIEQSHVDAIRQEIQCQPDAIFNVGLDDSRAYVGNVIFDLREDVCGQLALAPDEPASTALECLSFFSEKHWKSSHQDFLGWRRRAWKKRLVNPWAVIQSQAEALGQHPRTEIGISFDDHDYGLETLVVERTRALHPRKDLPDVDFNGLRAVATTLSPLAGALAVMMDASRKRIFSDAFRMGKIAPCCCLNFTLPV